MSIVFCLVCGIITFGVFGGVPRQVAAEHLHILHTHGRFVCLGDEDKGMKKAWEDNFPEVRSPLHSGLSTAASPQRYSNA